MNDTSIRSARIPGAGGPGAARWCLALAAVIALLLPLSLAAQTTVQYDPRDGWCGWTTAAAGS